MTLDKELAIKKITEMPTERVSKVLIFMAGMEAEHNIEEKSEAEEQSNLSNHNSATWAKMQLYNLTQLSERRNDLRAKMKNIEIINKERTDRIGCKDGWIRKKKSLMYGLFYFLYF